MKTFTIELSDALVQLADTTKLRQVIAEELAKQLLDRLDIKMSVETRDVP